MNKYSLYFIMILLISSSFMVGDTEKHKRLFVKKISDITDAVFKNLQMCYECEFAPVTRTHMKADGSYDQIQLLSEWAPNHDIFLLYSDNTPAGFCVVNHQSMIEKENFSTHDIAEFYVAPIFRHLGYGTWFAHYIFKLYPGRWEIRQLPELEKTSRSFWIEAIKKTTHSNFKEIKDHPQWEGFVQRFDYP